jgi:hypothetical protein
LKYEVKAQKEENGAVKSSFDSGTARGSLLRQVHAVSGKELASKTHN